jgi:hypothetical protein
MTAGGSHTTFDLYLTLIMFPRTRQIIRGSNQAS